MELPLRGVVRIQKEARKSQFKKEGKLGIHGNIKLAQWVYDQRKAQRSNLLKEDRKLKLEELGVEW